MRDAHPKSFNSCPETSWQLEGMTMAPESSLSPLRVLYVEDNDLVREITCELLADGLREVVAVTTAEEALSAFNSQPFDLVVTDVSLPAMSGVELVRRIQSIDPTVRIILASGYDLNAEHYQLRSNVRAIKKPFDLPTFDALIQELF
jgi:CheY-like chemotaxis protein